MSRWILMSLILCVFAGYVLAQATKPGTPSTASTLPAKGEAPMTLGNFSVSLAVKDVAASGAFYEKLGFHVIAGTPARFLIMQNDTCTIGLFHGLFEKNILTFNPGWDRNTKTLPNFDDVRDIQRTLESRGLTLATKADVSTAGPASITLYDPDGNQITIDQHVPSPAK